MAARGRDRGVRAQVPPREREGSNYTVEQTALWNIQRAIRVVRANAREPGIDPSRVGVMGFSAGGELAGRAAMSTMPTLEGDPGASDAIDRRSSRPNVQVLIYPGNASALAVSKGSLSVFIAAGYNDPPDISRRMAELYLKYKDAGVPAEHMYVGAGHEFALRASNKSASAAWPGQLVEWIEDMKLVSPR